jgi:uncharacterized protein (DUF305 family)
MPNQSHTEPSRRTSRRPRRNLVAFMLAAGLGITLAACGGDPESADAASATQTASNGDVFNDADVAFATDMIQHHAQALVMVDMTAGRKLDPEMQELTEQIRATQGREIETMTDWLTAWNKEVPETVRDHGNAGHGMGDSDDNEMPGMMPAEDLDALQHSGRPEFEDMWLAMMIEHHEGAIEMAKEEIERGTFEDAVAMAENIVSSQQREIDEMEKWLG